MHLEVLAILIIQLLKIILKINDIHLGRLRQSIQLKAKRLEQGHMLGAILQTTHGRHEPLGKLLDGCVHGLLTLDELQFKLHLVQR